MSSDPTAQDLHLISRLGDTGAWRVVAAGARAGRQVTVVLWGEAVLETPESIRRLLLGDGLAAPVRVVGRARDCRDLGVGGRWPEVSAEAIVDLLLESPAATSW